MQVDARFLAELLNGSADAGAVIAPEGEVSDALRRAARDGVASLDTICRTADGSLLQVELLLRLIEHPQMGRFVAAVLRQPMPSPPGESLPDIAHELRTPLTAIIGFAGLMLRARTGEMSPEHREYVDEIMVSSRRMLALIDQTFARHERGSNDA